MVETCRLADTSGVTVPRNIYGSFCALTIELQQAVPRQRKHAIWKLWSEVFQALVGLQKMSRSLAWISYLLAETLFRRGELATVNAGMT